MDDLQVKPAELHTQRNHQTIELSLRDLKILRLLFENRGKVVNRDALFNHCPGLNYLANSRTLDLHISKLRKAIELDSREPRIISPLQGIGYRFDN